MRVLCKLTSSALCGEEVIYSQTDLGWSSALPLSGGVALGKKVPFSEPQVPYLLSVNTNSIYYSQACFRSQIRAK